MFSSAVRRAADTVGEATPVDPAELVPLAELVVEGFGWGNPYLTTPRDVVDALAHQLGDDVVIDDLGRRCVTRETARRLFTEREAQERRVRQVQADNEARAAEQAAANVPRGIPASQIPDGVAPAAAMLQAARDAQPRRQSVLEAALANDGSYTYHPISGEDET
jgi:antitoxin component of MazEF toxin-antitoxin module